MIVFLCNAVQSSQHTSHPESLGPHYLPKPRVCVVGSCAGRTSDCVPCNGELPEEPAPTPTPVEGQTNSPVEEGATPVPVVLDEDKASLPPVAIGKPRQDRRYLLGYRAQHQLRQKESGGELL